MGWAQTPRLANIMETTRAVRTDDWKYVARHPDGPHELYDMRRDPQERFNLFGQPGTAARWAELAGRLDARLDETAAIRLRDIVSQIVTDGLGRTRWVDATGSDDAHPELPPELARMLFAMSPPPAIDAD